MDPFRAGIASHQSTPPGHIFSEYRANKNGTRIRVNVVAHQEEKKKKNIGMKEAEKRQTTEFRNTECYPSAVVWRVARQKTI